VKCSRRPNPSTFAHVIGMLPATPGYSATQQINTFTYWLHFKTDSAAFITRMWLSCPAYSSTFHLFKNKKYKSSSHNRQR